MTSILYIASDERGAGKTALCASLVSLLNQRGIKAAAIKPLAGEDELADAPESRAFSPSGGEISSKSQWPLVLTSDGVTDQLLKKVTTLVKGLSKDNEVVLVEGSNAISAADGQKLIEAFDAKVLAIIRHRHGMDASHLTHWKTHHPDRLLGFVFNSRGQHLDTEVKTTLLPSLVVEEMKSFGVIPEDRLLLAVTVGQIADHLGGRFLTEENDLDGLVEYFMVGGWILDEGRLYFETHDNKAVIMKGNRPDIQMAALATPTKAMICTNDLEPIEYVFYEAQETGAALMVVPTDTVATMESLNTIQDKVRVDHPAKIRRFTELVEQYANVDGLLAALDVKSS